jgi:diadenosine tetraphosphate (Ap4A) HIT family hydrolase
VHHYRKTVKQYHKRQQRGCPFCDEKTLAKAVFKNDLVYVVPNLTHYDLWELHDVTDHLLVMPKRHVKSLQELTPEERLAIMDVAARYESQGYNVYARGVDFVVRSVEHQHTHLIKATHKRPRLAFYLRRPYFVVKF